MPGRNDPCPCGSGLKFKKCCGAVIAIEAARRVCGTCTACCDGWVAGVIEGHEMKPGQPCHFRGEGCCTSGTLGLSVFVRLFLHTFLLFDIKGLSYSFVKFNE